MVRMDNERPFLLSIVAAFAAVLLWSALAPLDRFTWFLEVVPALIAFPLLAATYRRFPFTRLAYVLMLAHAVVLFVGGHYTYAEVPLFNTIRELFHQSRNNYDKLGHFMQGFVPAIVAREVLLRTSPLRRGKWLSVLVVAVCLAISALYELFEWAMTMLSGASAEAFLGTQGYAWDTQSDMAFALVGAVTALLVLGRWHDRSLSLRMNEIPTEKN
jgi:putative membrane protein